VYIKVADSDDVVIQKQGFAIFDTHEPVIAMPVSSFCLHTINSYPHRNQIFPKGRHQEVRRFVPLGLHHLTSVSSHSGMSRNERLTSTLFGSFLPSPAAILCHQQAFRTVIYLDRYLARKWWRGESGTGVWREGLMRGTPFS